MTISTSSSSVILLGNGSTSIFSFPFIGGIASNIQVIYTDADGLETLLPTSSYSVFLNPAVTGSLWGVGGNVTYPTSGSPIASGTSLTISRLAPLTQLVSISDQGALTLSVIEKALDTLCMEIQQVSARTGQLRGVWQTGIDYNFGDIVQDGVNGSNTSNYYTCAKANTSSTWQSDLADGAWSLSLNVQAIVVGGGTIPIVSGGTGATTAQVALDNLGTVNDFRMGATFYPYNSYPQGTNTYLVMDKGGTTADASIVFRDQGNARGEVGIIGDDNFHIKVVTGTYPSETFTDAIIIPYSATSVDCYLPLLRAYDPNNTPTLIAGNSDLSTGAGLELQYDQTNAHANITSIERGNVFRALNLISNSIVYQQGQSSTAVVGTMDNSGRVFFAGSTAPSAYVHMAAGTAATGTAPLKFTAGTNLTAAVAGAEEYDGTVFYATPVISNRGVIDVEHFQCLSSGYTGSDVNTAQQVFNATAAGAITLPSSTSYYFEALYLMTRSAGTNSHTISTLFAGTATLTSIAYRATATSTTGNIIDTSPTTKYNTVATAVAVTGASTSSTENNVIELKGIIRVNAGGTLIPQIKFSAAPGGAPTFLANSFIRLIPLGSNTVTNVGNWS